MTCQVLCRVWRNNFNQQMLISVPKECGLTEDDFVMVTKTEPPMSNHTCKKCGKRYNEHTLKELYGHGLFGIKGR